MNLGFTDIIRIGMRIVSHREEITKVWTDVAPLIQAITRISPQIKGLFEKVAPNMLADLMPTQPPPQQPGPGEPPAYSVMWLQDSLNKLSNAGLEVDGDYGEMTRAAVRKYQEQNGLEVDGWVGVETQAHIDAALTKLGQPA